MRVSASGDRSHSQSQETQDNSPIGSKVGKSRGSRGEKYSFRGDQIDNQTFSQNKEPQLNEGRSSECKRETILDHAEIYEVSPTGFIHRVFFEGNLASNIFPHEQSRVVPREYKSKNIKGGDRNSHFAFCRSSSSMSHLTAVNADHKSLVTRHTHADHE
eukprot:2993309-Amphidinium_carterae.2